MPVLAKLPINTKNLRIANEKAFQQHILQRKLLKG